MSRLLSAATAGLCVLALGLTACSEPVATGAQAGGSSAQAGTASAPAPSAGAAGLDLAGRLAELEHRKELIEDANDIKRLQRAYGYYVDEALWDEVTDLFADDGSIEIALDGVFVGKERIREYLYALGNGRSGLSHGQLSEHMQLMPVVSVDADGLTARARWRGIVLGGELGTSAFWAEGPYENEYIKEDGTWKLKRVHWFQSMAVPYERGWQFNADINGGKWVSGLTPDRPSSIEYATWPSTFLPPFHFANPVTGAGEALEARNEQIAALAAARASESEASMDELAERAGILAAEIARLEDENAIENLQRIYGFYVEEGFWSEAADLFADSGTIEVGNSGVYVGRDRVLAYLRTFGEEFPQDGRLFDRMQLQPVVHVSPDGRTARARWRLFAQEAEHGEFARWGAGIYENEYVNEDGVWKIASLRVYNTMYSPYEDGWGVTALANNEPSESLPPDRPPSMPHETYPAVFVAPYHYENPVTGSPVFAGKPADYGESAPVDAAGLRSALDTLSSRVGRLEDTDQIERLNAIYGYYLARNQWDNLAGIFAPDGSIEIALRGVYVGRDAVRRNLNLYGEPGIHHGLLHNHMQYQPVISVADDGRTARVRSRAFSIMGQHEDNGAASYSMWMGGIYENRLVKIDGIWQLEWDQVFNSYFIPYNLGWRDAPPRSPPGVSPANPPDLPPTHPFEMYPTAFVPPFHYANPVTGNEVIWPPD